MNSVYGLFSALIMHIYEMRSSVQTTVSASRERIDMGMDALKAASKVWLVAKMLHTMFECLLRDNVLEEGLQKAGNRQDQTTRNAIPADETEIQLVLHQAIGKRKYDQLKISFSQSPQLSLLPYRRSRPETPLVNPCLDSASKPSNLGATLPVPVRNMSDHFLSTSLPRSPSCGPSLSGIGQISRLNGYTISAISANLSFVTPNSPPSSQFFWESFQPNPLLPDQTGIPISVSPCDGSRVDRPTQMAQDRPVQEPQNHSMHMCRQQHQFDGSAVDTSIISQAQSQSPSQSQSLDVMPMKMGRTYRRGRLWPGMEDRS
jgi:hypothetical protein